MFDLLAKCSQECLFKLVSTGIYVVVRKLGKFWLPLLLFVSIWESFGNNKLEPEHVSNHYKKKKITIYTNNIFLQSRLKILESMQRSSIIHQNAVDNFKIHIVVVLLQCSCYYISMWSSGNLVAQVDVTSENSSRWQARLLLLWPEQSWPPRLAAERSSAE